MMRTIKNLFKRMTSQMAEFETIFLFVENVAKFANYLSTLNTPTIRNKQRPDDDVTRVQTF